MNQFAATGETFTITFVGDTLIGHSARKSIKKNGYGYLFASVRELLRADYLIGNAEAPITVRREPFFKDQRWHYNAAPAVTKILRKEGFDAMGLANNHAFDRGPQGLADTIEHLSHAGITPFGSGLDKANAEAPLMIDSPAGKIAVIAAGKRWRMSQVATEEIPGVAYLSRKSIGGMVDRARLAGAEHLVAYVHWGQNYSPMTVKQERDARVLVEAGFDLVVGHQPHIVQDVHTIDGVPVIYSLGNFIFGTKGRFSGEAPGYGFIAETRWSNVGLDSVLLTCIRTDNEVVEYQPRRCTHDEISDLKNRITIQKHPTISIGVR